MSVIKIEKCPVCGSGDFKKVFDAVDHFSSREVFPVCDCRVCGFRFTNNFPSEDVIGKYYDSPDYISHSDSVIGMTNKLYHLVRRELLKRKIRLVKKDVARKNARLLDIGCGTGYFLHAAKEAGLRVTGIEKNSMAREKASSLFSLDVREESAFFHLQPSSFDAVTLWHVLEHLEKLNESLEKVNEILTPDGTVILALPNHLSYDARIYGNQWAAYDVPRHLWHFTPFTLEKLLKRHHMKVVKKYRMPLDAFYISLLSEKYRGSNLWGQYGRAFLTGTAGFFRSLHKPEQSSSLIYIVHKDA